MIIHFYIASSVKIWYHQNNTMRMLWCEVLSMNQMDLIKRLMNRNSDAFLEMTDKYSWPVYQAIRTRVSDSRQADHLFHKTMDGFYRSLHESKTNDPVEALLLIYTEKVLLENQKTGGSFQSHEKNIHVSGTDEKGGFFRIAVNFLLIAAIAVMLWVIVGLLMDMNLIPAYDLGYTWFHSNIAQLF